MERRFPNRRLRWIGLSKHDAKVQAAQRLKFDRAAIWLATHLEIAFHHRLFLLLSARPNKYFAQKLALQSARCFDTQALPTHVGHHETTFVVQFPDGEESVPF